MIQRKSCILQLSSSAKHHDPPRCGLRWDASGCCGIEYRKILPAGAAWKRQAVGGGDFCGSSDI